MATKTKKGTAKALKTNEDRAEEVRVLLKEGPKSRSQLAEALGVSRSRVTQVLAGLPISSKKEGREKLYSLAAAATVARAKAPARANGNRRRSGAEAALRRNAARKANASNVAEASGALRRELEDTEKRAAQLRSAIESVEGLR